MGVRKEAFVELLNVDGKPMTFDGRTVLVMYGKADDIDIEPRLSASDQTIFSIRTLRDYWPTLPKEGDHVTNPAGDKHRVVYAPDDKVSDTVQFYLVS